MLISEFAGQSGEAVSGCLRQSIEERRVGSYFWIKIAIWYDSEGSIATKMREALNFVDKQ